MSTFEHSARWVEMWGIAFAIYGAAKAGTLAAGRARGASAGQKLAYLLLWTGMDAPAFCSGVARRASPAAKARPHTAADVARFVRNVACGVVLFWGVARLVPVGWELLRGWVGMIGLIMMVHFGALQMVSAAWRARGLEVPLLMERPLAAKSVGEFWGVRWNTAFQTLSYRYVFRPLARRLGAAVAMWMTFAASGVVHDVVISVPAGGGYGLPTVYFLLQGCGVALERSSFGRRVLRGAVGRGFAILMVAAPVPLLFHGVFVRRVFLPFMVACGA